MNCLTAGFLALITCLGDPDPAIRDKVAFEKLSAAMRSDTVDRDTLGDAKTQLLKLVDAPDPGGFQRPFAILTLAEVARTDRIKPWMTTGDREALVNVASTYLSSLTDYRAFDDREGFRHGVAHAADFVMQLALNPAIAKPQLDRLRAAIATQVAPATGEVAYWAGEPDRLGRAVLVIAQRKLHTDAEWKAWFDGIVDPKPLASWNAAFESAAGIRKRHNTRAFLLSLFATATTSEDAGIRQLAAPARDALKAVQ
jgi:hypothetical protein